MDEEKECPICSKKIRSDATVNEYCKLCGMGIPEPEEVPNLQTDDEKKVYFCCERCYTIYKRNIDRS
jgi:hypothetical protein